MIEIGAGIALLWVCTTGAAADALSAEVMTVGFITAVFMTGVGYADIRSKANAAHRRLDERKREDENFTAQLDKRFERFTTAIDNLTIALERNGIQVARGTPHE